MSGRRMAAKQMAVEAGAAAAIEKQKKELSQKLFDWRRALREYVSRDGVNHLQCGNAWALRTTLEQEISAHELVNQGQKEEMMRESLLEMAAVLLKPGAFFSDEIGLNGQSNLPDIEGVISNTAGYPLIEGDDRSGFLEELAEQLRELGDKEVTPVDIEARVEELIRPVSEEISNE